MYGEVLFYIQVTVTRSLLDDRPSLLAYVQTYDHFNTDGMVEQRRMGDKRFIDVSTIRCLVGRFQCAGSQAQRNAFPVRTWFIDRTRMYKMMKVVTGYTIGGQVDVSDVSDDSGDQSNDDEDDLFNFISDDE